MAQNNNGNFIEEIAFWDFDKENYNGNADVIFYIHSYKQVGTHSYQFYSLQHKLEQSKEDLFGKMSPNLRNVIRKAETMDSFRIEIDNDPSDKQIQRFLNIYNPFALFKGLSEITFDYLKQLKICKKLVLSFFCSKENGDLVAHTHYASKSITRLYHSASSEKLYETKMSSFANAYLTWKEIIYFKENNFDIYDFGGTYNVGADPNSVIGIVNFKKRFGGEEVILWKGVDPISINGENIIKKYWKKQE